jgi:hypothetical protein
MDRFPCHGRLSLVVNISEGLIHLKMSHDYNHPKYVDVETPPEARELIDELSTVMPLSLIARQVQQRWPHVTSSQVHFLWRAATAGQWKRYDDQMKSAQTLLAEHADDFDTLNLEPIEGVTALGWGLKQVHGLLCRSGHLIEEVSIDATCIINDGMVDTLLTYNWQMKQALKTLSFMSVLVK